jgi:hypothetical protein
VVIEVPMRLLQTFKEVFMDECYMNGKQRSIPKGGSVIDIGTNAGFFSLSRIDQIAMEVHEGPEPRQNIDSLEQFFKHHGFRTQRRSVDMLWAWKVS